MTTRKTSFSICVNGFLSTYIFSLCRFCFSFKTSSEIIALISFVFYFYFKKSMQVALKGCQHLRIGRLMALVAVSLLVLAFITTTVDGKDLFLLYKYSHQDGLNVHLRCLLIRSISRSFILNSARESRKDRKHLVISTFPPRVCVVALFSLRKARHKKVFNSY